MPGSDYCYMHSPEHTTERKNNATKGGKTAGRGRPVAELAALRAENADIRHKLLDGELEPKVASVAIQSLNVDSRLVDVVLRAREQEQLEGRMTDLEAALKAESKFRRGSNG